MFYRELKHSFWLALPLMVALVTETSLGLIDSAMMGYLGPLALAAGALAIGAFWLGIVVSFGTLSAVGICTSQALGAGEPPSRVIHYLQQGAYLSLLLATPVMLLTWHAGFILRATGQDPAVTVLAVQLLHGITWAVPAEFGFYLLWDFVSSLEKTRILMFVALCALPLNAALDYGFVFGVWGLPKWGMFGIGLSTSIVLWCMMLSLFSYCLIHSKTRLYLWQRFCKPHITTVLHLLRIGLPSGFLLLFEVGLFVISAFMMGRVGTITLAAHQVVLQCVEISFMFVLGVAKISSIRVARNAGAKNWQGVKIAAAANLTLGLSIAAIFGVIFLLFPDRLTDVFINIDNNQHAALLVYTKQFFLLAMVFVLFDALQCVGNNVLRGLKDTVVPMFLGIGSYWVIGITTGYVLAFKLGWGGVGIWCGLFVGVGVAGTILWLRWLYVMRRVLYLAPE